jgi:hypothetical protein
MGDEHLDFVRSQPVFATAEELIEAYGRELNGQATHSGRLSRVHR